TSATIGSGSGYGTSSGSKRAIVEASQMTSPPLRSVRTSELPSTRCALIESVRPVAKYAISARAATGLPNKDTKVTKDTKAAGDAKVAHRAKAEGDTKAAAVTPLAPFPPLCPLFTFVSFVRVRGGRVSARPRTRGRRAPRARADPCCSPLGPVPAQTSYRPTRGAPPSLPPPAARRSAESF